MQAPVDSAALIALLGRFPAPEIIDVRSAGAIDEDPVVIPGALVRDPAALLDWSLRLERWRDVVVDCTAGHARRVDAASSLCARGVRAPQARAGDAGRGRGVGRPATADAATRATR